MASAGPPRQSRFVIAAFRSQTLPNTWALIFCSYQIGGHSADFLRLEQIAAGWSTPAFTETGRSHTPNHSHHEANGRPVLWRVINVPISFANEILTTPNQSPSFPLSRLDQNKKGTYKNVTETRRKTMLSFIKDFAALVTLCGFTVASLTWMDVIARLV